MLLYDRGDATVRDYATFYLSNLASAGSNTPGQWKLEYDFAQTYGTRSYTAAGCKALAESIRAKPSVRQTFIDHYAVDVSPPPKIKPDDEDNWLAYACTQTALTPDAYAACRCPGARQR